MLNRHGEMSTVGQMDMEGRGEEWRRVNSITQIARLKVDNYTIARSLVGKSRRAVAAYHANVEITRDPCHARPTHMCRRIASIPYNIHIGSAS